MIRITAKEMNIKPFNEDWASSDTYMTFLEPICSASCIKEVAVALEAANLAAKCDSKEIEIAPLSIEATQELEQLGYSVYSSVDASLISWNIAA